MEEAAVLGKRIGIISAGNMVCIGSTLFLIEKFGKFISINIIKDKNCVNDDVIKFIKTIGKDEDDEIYSGFLKLIKMGFCLILKNFLWNWIIMLNY